MSVADSLAHGLLKSTLVHRHAFIPSLAKTIEIGRAARLPESLALELSFGTSAAERDLAAGRWSQARRTLKAQPSDSAQALLGLLNLFGHGPSGLTAAALLARIAAPAGLRRLESLSARRPEYWPAKAWLGVALLRACDLPGARRAFDSLITSRPRWAWSYLLRSELGRVDIDFEGASADLARARRLEPKNAWGRALSARVHFQAGSQAAGLAELDEAIRHDPQAGWMRAWRGDARRKRGDAAGALRDLREALRLEPEYDRTYLWLGKTLLSLGRFEAAIESLDEGLSRCPHFEKAFAERSRALRGLGRIEPALRDLNRAVRLNHRHNWLGNWTAEPAPLRPEQERWLAALERYAHRTGSAWALAWLGESQVQAGDARGGASTLDRALLRRPDLAWAWAWRGEARLKLGDLDSAKRDLARSVRLDPSYGRAYAWRGRTHQLSGEHRAAVEDFGKAVGDSLVEYSWLYFWKAQSLRACGREGQARQEARSALALEPHRSQFRSFLATA